MAAAAVPVENTPARVYLERWRVWPPDGPALPESVRWIPAPVLAAVLPWSDEFMPEGEWAGALAFRYSGERSAWKLEALTASGQRPDQAQTGSR